MDQLRWLDQVGDPSSVAIWSGAGLSADWPTCGPLGNTLTFRAFKYVFIDVRSSAIAQWFQQAGMPTEVPRLETVLGVVQDYFGDAGLNWLLRDLHEMARHPNDLHRFAAEHLAAGGSHITANVDRCIEAAALPRANLRDLVHFHGALDDVGSTADLGVVLDRIEAGFPKAMTTRLSNILSNPNVTTLLVAGYSGSDFFDVLPFLEKLPDDALRGTTVVWCDHSDGDLHELAPDALAAPGSVMLQLLCQRGAQAVVLKGPLRRAIAHLAERWDLTSILPLPAGSTPPVQWRSTLPPELTHGLQVTASLELYVRLGLPNLVLQYHDAHRDDGLDLDRSASAIGEAWRTAGDPRRFFYWVRRAWPGSSADDVAMREERRVQALRGAGRPAEAARLAARLSTWSARRSSSLTPTTRLVVIDAATAVLHDQYRAPLGRLRPHRNRAKQLLRELHDVQRARAMDLALRTERIESNLRTMTGHPHSTTPDSSAATHHAQASSVIRTLNYRQGLLRSPGHVGPKHESEFRELFKTWLAMGQYAEIARMVVSPLAIHALPLDDIAESVRQAARTGRWPRGKAASVMARSVLAGLTQRRQ